LALTLAPAALAQTGQRRCSALKGHNSNAPVDVTADRIEVQDRADRAIFAGNVHVKQAELTLDTARLTVAYSSGGGGSRSAGSTPAAEWSSAARRKPRGRFRNLRPRPQADHLIGNVQLNRGESRSTARGW
jgi:lipopolysaccharide export system protein LptA